MSLGGGPRSAAESAWVDYGGNSSMGAGGNNGGTGGNGVGVGSIGGDGLGAPELGLFSDSFGFPMEELSFDGVLSAVATGSHLAPGTGGNEGVIGSGRRQQQLIQQQSSPSPGTGGSGGVIGGGQQLIQQQPSPSSGSQHQPQVSPRQQQQQQQQPQQLQQQAREQAAAAHQQPASVSTQLTPAAAGQLLPPTLPRTKQLNKVAGQSSGAIVGGAAPNPGPTSSPVGPSAPSVNTNHLRRPTALNIQRLIAEQQRKKQMLNTQAGGVGNGAPQLALDDVTVRGTYFPDIPRILPHERVFPIQIGSELFRLSGASISSDAPSYFSQFFEQQLVSGPDTQVKTLYIDRDPATFRDIARHLQGYYITPEDAGHYVRLFADAQFYSLPKLISQLYESDFYIFIGGTHFRIPRDIFSSPGDSSNFFGLNLSVNFTKSGELFPGLPREGLLRPPSIAPPNVPNHSPETFKELLHVLRGYPIHIRNEEHRQELLQDCRYYNLRCLEQKLIPHSISYNLRRDRREIVIRIEDIKPSRIALRHEIPQPNQIPSPDAPVGFVVYGRPWVDDEDYELIVEIGGETTKFDRRDMRVEFVGQTNRRVTNFLQKIADKLNLPTTQPLGLQMMAQAQQAAAAAAGAAGGASSGGGSAGGRSGSGTAQGGLPPSPGNTPLSEDKVKVWVDRAAHIILDGEEVEWVPFGANEDDGSLASVVGEDGLTPGNAYQLNVPPPPRSASSGSPNVVTWSPPPPPPPTSSHHQASPLQSRAHQPPPPPPPPRPLKRRRLSPDSDSGSFTPRAGGSGGGGGGGQGGGEWIIKRGQWRVRVQRTSNSDGKGGMEVVLCAVKLEAFSGELGRNMGRSFLA